MASIQSNNIQSNDHPVAADGDSMVKDDVLQHARLLNQKAVADNALIEPVQEPVQAKAVHKTRQIPGSFDLDPSLVAAFPDEGATLVQAVRHEESLWGVTVKIVAKLPSGEHRNYFAKIVSMGEHGRAMCEGEYESLKAISAVNPEFCPEPYAWGRYEKPEPETYFLLVSFRNILQQPAVPEQLAQGLAALHTNSVSPTGKFGFHIRTSHTKVTQAIDFWDSSWCNVFKSHLAEFIDHAVPQLQWPEFNVVAELTLSHVVPRLLLPLQENGRNIKPSLVHGDCWDGNTAMDGVTGKAFILDVCSFYAHNEYDIGNWRTPRHLLSDPDYLKAYTDIIYPSEPVEDWDARNILYSLPFNIANTLYIPGSTQRPVIYNDMLNLCQMFCAEQLEEKMNAIGTGRSNGHNTSARNDDSEDEEEEEEED